MKIKNLLYNLSFCIRYFSFRSTLNNTMVFVVDDSRRHPGLVDRLKAIVCVYDIAKSNGLDYKIYHNYNFFLENYLLPNKINWVIKKVNYNPLTTKMYSYSGYERMHPTISGSKKQFCIYNYQGKNYLQQNTIEDWEKRWRDLFWELFIPSDILQNSINNHLDFIGSDYIAVHFRFVNALEQFEEGHASTLKTEQEKSVLINKCLNALRDIKESNSQFKIVVFTDSNVFRDIAKLNGYVVTPGVVSHTSFSKGDDSNLKTFTDLFVISKAEKIYRIESEHIYKTMFSFYAAIIGGKECIDYKI